MKAERKHNKSIHPKLFKGLENRTAKHYGSVQFMGFCDLPLYLLEDRMEYMASFWCSAHGFFL